MEVGHKPTFAHRKNPGSAIRLKAVAGVLDRGGGLTVIGGSGAEYMGELARTHQPRPRLNSCPRTQQDWKEHAGVLAAVIDGDEDLAELLATRHVQSAAAFAAAAQEATIQFIASSSSSPPPSRGRWIEVYRAFIGREARCMPASTIRNSPVMFDALARKNSTASAICSGVPAWRSGVFCSWPVFILL